MKSVVYTYQVYIIVGNVILINFNNRRKISRKYERNVHVITRFQRISYPLNIYWKYNFMQNDLKALPANSILYISDSLISVQI